jgi:hypothetical protein
MGDDRLGAILPTLKRAAAALRDADVPFALAGDLAWWARGGPVNDDDIDLLVTADDVGRAVRVLEEAGMTPHDPPEEWLSKVHDGTGDNKVTVDLIFRPSGIDVTPTLLARAEHLQLDAMTMPVLPLEDVAVTQLLALNEYNLAYEGLVAAARAVREQVDWDDVRGRTAHSPFARAFFVIAEGVGIVPAEAPRVRH